MKRRLGVGFYYSVLLAMLSLAICTYFAITAKYFPIVLLSFGPITFPVMRLLEAWHRVRNDTDPSCMGDG